MALLSTKGINQLMLSMCEAWVMLSVFCQNVEVLCQYITCIVYSDLPQVRIAQSQYSVLYGGSVYMECTVENAVPPVTAVRWYKGTSVNHFNLSIDVRASKYSGGVLDNPSLNITNVVPSDEGFYSCNATNLVGTASAWTFFDVYGGMFNRCFGICCENIVLPFLWFRKVSFFEKLYSKVFNLKIWISSNLFFISNLLPFGCLIFFFFCLEYFLFSFSLDIPSITLRNTSYSVMVGDPVTLACDYNSSPAPTAITWQRIQNAQSTNINVLDSRFGGGTIVTPYLTIRTTLLSDAGVYTCSVTNQVGTTTGNPIFLFINGSEYRDWSESRVHGNLWLIITGFFFAERKINL